jgi:leader peptidase (prepilin peptidase)/N-methyltransferase
MVVAIAFLFGAFIGSFLNVCIHRLPRNESVVMPPSRCYSCGTHVQWYDNLPVVSWLALRGACRWCGARFSPRYLVMELLVGALTAAVVGWAFSWGGQAVPSPWLLAAGGDQLLARALAGAAALALVYYLLVAALIDLDHLIIPDELTKSFQLGAPFLGVLTGASLAYGDVLGVRGWLWRIDVYGAERALTPDAFLTHVLGIGAAVLGFLALSLPAARWIYTRYCPEQQRWSDDDHRGFRIGVLWYLGASAVALAALAGLALWAPAGNWWPALAAHGAYALLGSFTGWLALYLVGLVGTVVFRRNAMGFGDVKFLAPVGAFLGPVGVLYAFFAAAVVGAVAGVPLRLLKERREIPFGPYLAAGALLVLWLGPELHRWLFGALLH